MHIVLLTTPHRLDAQSLIPHRLDAQCLTDNPTQVGYTKSYWQRHTGWMHKVLFHTGWMHKVLFHTGWMHNVLLTTPHRLDAQSLTDNPTQVGCTKSYWPLHTGWMHKVLFHTGWMHKVLFHTGWMHNVLLTTSHRLDAQCLTDNSTQVGCTMSYW